jgi:hypothetical protein
MNKDEVLQYILLLVIDQDIPDHFKWFAVDGDGQVCMYQTKPVECGNHRQEWIHNIAEEQDSDWEPVTTNGRELYIDLDMLNTSWAELVWEIDNALINF